MACAPIGIARPGFTCGPAARTFASSPGCLTARAGRRPEETAVAEPMYGPPGAPIEVVPVVVLSQVFPARPSSIPDIRDFVRRCLAESPLTEDGTREVGETVFRALLDAAGPTGSIQVAFRIFPEHVEVDVLHSDTAIPSPVIPGPPVTHQRSGPAGPASQGAPPSAAAAGPGAAAPWPVPGRRRGQPRARRPGGNPPARSPGRSGLSGARIRASKVSPARVAVRTAPARRPPRRRALASRAGTRRTSSRQRTRPGPSRNGCRVRCGGKGSPRKPPPGSSVFPSKR